MPHILLDILNILNTSKGGSQVAETALIRNFVKRIEIVDDEAVLTYTIPMPSDGVTSYVTSPGDRTVDGAHRPRGCFPLPTLKGSGPKLERSPLCAAS